MKDLAVRTIIDPFFVSASDATKRINLVASAVPTGTTLTWGALVANGTVALQDGSWGTNYIPRYDGSGVLVNSGINDDGANLTTALRIISFASTDVTIGDSGITANGSIFRIDDATHRIWAAGLSRDIVFELHNTSDRPTHAFSATDGTYQSTPDGSTVTLSWDNAGQITSTGNIYAQAFSAAGNIEAHAFGNTAGTNPLTIYQDEIGGSIFIVCQGPGSGNSITLTDGAMMQLTDKTSGKSAILDTSFLSSTNKTFQFPDASGMFALLSAAQTFTGINEFHPAARSSGSAPYFKISAPTDTGLTASTEAIGIQISGATRQHTAGSTIATQREIVISATSYSFSSANTITNAITLDIAKPTAGSNATLTNAYALRVDDMQATGTINKITLTQPATGSTITISDGRTLTVNNSLTLAGTNGTTMTFPGASDTVAGLGTTQTFTGVNTFNAGSNTVALKIGSTPSIQFIPSWNGTGGWIDMDTGGASGLGSGGAGSNAWIGYCNANGNWFGDSAIGDICYRNVSHSLLFGNSSSGSTLKINGDLITIVDQHNVAMGTTNGTKFGTATSQKIGFWNATPIVQVTTGVAGATFVAGSGTAVNDASTFDSYTIKQVVKALRNMGLLA